VYGVGRDDGDVFFAAYRNHWSHHHHYCYSAACLTDSMICYVACDLHYLHKNVRMVLAQIDEHHSQSIIVGVLSAFLR
jgi:hypothetical protein